VTSWRYTETLEGAFDIVADITATGELASLSGCSSEITGIIRKEGA